MFSKKAAIFTVFSMSWIDSFKLHCTILVLSELHVTNTFSCKRRCTFEKIILNVDQNEMYDNFFTKHLYIFLQKHLWFCFRTEIKFRMMKFELSSATD